MGDINNESLVFYVYNSYFSGFNKYKDDLIQEGNIGLIKATNKFDPNKGSFSTFAFYLIKNQMLDYLRWTRGKSFQLTFFDDSKNNWFNELQLYTADDSIEKIDDHDALMCVLSQFNKEELYVIRLWADGHSIVDISKRTNFSVGKVFGIISNLKRDCKKEFSKS